MVPLSPLPSHFSWFALILLHSLEGVRSSSVPYLNPGFEFNYNTPGQALPLPITNQCDTIHVTWSRTSNETGPSPVAPYVMQVYSSASSVPYIVDAGFGTSLDWQVPFSSSTQYQTCMFDANGASGGCQQIYTILPSPTNSSCRFPPPPPAAASVSAVVPNGPMSQFSQINQCETLSVTPQSGNPPFTLTVAPESHPPYNITSKDMNAISWQVPLPVGSKFFLSLSSSDGQLWSNGPMSVGGLGGDSCVVSSGEVNKNLFEKVVIGASVGGLALGFAMGALCFFVLARFKTKGRAPSQHFFDSERYRDQAARDSPTRPLKAPPSTIGHSTSISAFSTAQSESAPTVNSIPLTPTTLLSPVRHSDAPPLPRNPSTPPRPRRQRSTSREPYMAVPNDASPSLPEFPPDIKHPIPSNDVSFFSRDDTESLASSSNTHARSTTRPLSTHSRAPTYVPRSSQLRGTVQRIEEAETPEMPPQYGRHTEDPHLKYAPSVLSSGNRF